MVFQLTGLQRNTYKNVDERERMEERAQFCSLDSRKQHVFFMEYKIIIIAVRIGLKLEEIREG